LPQGFCNGVNPTISQNNTVPCFRSPPSFRELSVQNAFDNIRRKVSRQLRPGLGLFFNRCIQFGIFYCYCRLTGNTGEHRKVIGIKGMPARHGVDAYDAQYFSFANKRCAHERSDRQAHNGLLRQERSSFCASDDKIDCLFSMTALTIVRLTGNSSDDCLPLSRLLPMEERVSLLQCPEA